MLRIGIDFDNTMACYDRAFVSVAGLLGIDLLDNSSNKIEVKQEIQSRTKGDLVWQRLQGQVYGKHMLLAIAFPGIHEFIFLARLRGHQVFIISHKSIYGHFDVDRIPLRSQAKIWLDEKKFLRSSQFGLKEENIFFESTRADKIGRIKELNCTHFIDDLVEIFDDNNFPPEVQKFLFDPAKSSGNKSNAIISSSWRQIADNILGPWSEHEVLQAVQDLSPKLRIYKAELMTGRANSQVYKLSSIDAQNYLLKIYPDRQSDSRPRLETEFATCQILSQLSYPVGFAVTSDVNFGWGIYEWLDGAPISNSDKAFIQESLKFACRLYVDSHRTEAFARFSNASEACLSGIEISDQIEKRVNKLLTVRDPVLSLYLNNDFIPTFNFVSKNAKKSRGYSFFEPLPRRYQMVSPSDFGSHNAFRQSSGAIVFYDFEYFGWDDPVKFVSDFYWHPGMNLNTGMRTLWRDGASAICYADPDFSSRLIAYLPLFGLRWCLIILNEFLKSEISLGIDTQWEPKSSASEMCSYQLGKAKALLQEIKEHLHHG